jgi:hypothetical protein
MIPNMEFSLCVSNYPVLYILVRFESLYILYRLSQRLMHGVQAPKTMTQGVRFALSNDLVII